MTDFTSTQENHEAMRTPVDPALLKKPTKSKAKLEEDQIRTEAMINSLGEGLIMTDESGKITTINTYALQCLGFMKHELLGTWFPKSIISVDKNSKEVNYIDRHIIRALTTGQAVSDRVQYLRKNGTILPVFVTVSPVLIDGRPAGAIEVFRDLTKEAQLDIAKDEFVSLASHQLRTPATGVKLILSMLAGGDFGPLSETQLKYLHKAILSNERQLHIIEDLLNAARVDAGKMDLDFEYADLSTIIYEVVSEHSAIFEARQQSVELAIPPQTLTFVDPSKIRMVIDNLLSNASKYSQSGGKIIIKLTQKNSEIVLQFCDQGIGMSPDDISKLFTKFTRIKNEFSTSVSGTGLGLFLVKNIVELHSGTVTASSEEGKGSTFTVRLPINREI